MSVDDGPTLRRRRLGAELRRCREAAGLTQEQVSREFEWHAAKVTRIEAARAAVAPRDVKDLLNLYDVKDQERREFLIQLARSSRERAWWSEYRDLLPAGSFIPLEADASVLRNWEPSVVPGLLQTEAYLRALFSVMRRQQSHIDRAVSLRLARQRRLTYDPPLALFAVVDESAVHREIGGKEVMSDQLRHLITMSQLPTVDLRVLPFGAREHPLLGTPLAILEFRDAPELDMVYLEQLRGTHHFIKQQAEVTQCKEEFDELTTRCLDQRQTVELIKGILGRHTS